MAAHPDPRSLPAGPPDTPLRQPASSPCMPPRPSPPAWSRRTIPRPVARTGTNAPPGPSAPPPPPPLTPTSHGQEPCGTEPCRRSPRPPLRPVRSEAGARTRPNASAWTPPQRDIGSVVVRLDATDDSVTSSQKLLNIVIRSQNKDLDAADEFPKGRSSGPASDFSESTYSLAAMSDPWGSDCRPWPWPYELTGVHPSPSRGPSAAQPTPPRFDPPLPPSPFPTHARPRGCASRPAALPRRMPGKGGGEGSCGRPGLEAAGRWKWARACCPGLAHPSQRALPWLDGRSVRPFVSRIRSSSISNPRVPYLCSRRRISRICRESARPTLIRRMQPPPSALFTIQSLSCLSPLGDAGAYVFVWRGGRGGGSHLLC